MPRVLGSAAAAAAAAGVAVVLLSAGVTNSQNVGQLCADYESCFDCAEHVTSADYVQFKYTACGDQLNIVPDHITCNPFSTDNFTYPNETLAPGEYRHYHWTLTTYSLINHEAGASITFEVVPEYGYPQMFTKAQILYGGLPMCQMFETKPGTEGNHSDTWPFPDKSTGARAQGPEYEIAQLEASNLPSAQTFHYPGDVFSEVTWGFNASGYDSDKRPKVHTVTIPHVSYGGYFVSVYAGDDKPARYSISVNAVRTIDIEEEVTHYAEEETPDGVEAAAGWWESDYCNALSTKTSCEQHCCTWELWDDEDASRRLSQVGTPAFQRRLQGEDEVDNTGHCIQASADIICVSEKESDETDEVPEPTILVSFQTEAGQGKRYKLYYVEMNDCASQMDRNGQNFCWQGGWFTDGGRLDDFLQEGGKWLEPNWQTTCGKGNGGDETDGYICDPSFSEPGYCNFDGTIQEDGNPAETMWSNAYDCIVWTPNGLSTHGLPVEYVLYQDQTGAWAELGSDFNGDVDSLYGSYNSSLRLKGIVTSFGRSVNTKATYNDWLTLPPSTWITTEIPIYNNISYFFNVLVDNSGNLGCYKGTSARTYFWRQTVLIPVEMIEIIAVVVVLALLALLVPFILTKRKITAHLRDVYESHKYKGYLKGVEERVIEERARRQGLQAGQADVDSEDEAVKKSEEETGKKHHHHHKKKDRKHKAKKTQVVPNSKPKAPKHAAPSKESKDDPEAATAQLSDKSSTSL